MNFNGYGIIEPNIQTVIIPATSFYSPYWVLNLMLFTAFLIGLFIGFGSFYGWKRLFFKIQMMIAENFL